jgi:hypothetical protein
MQSLIITFIIISVSFCLGFVAGSVFNNRKEKDDWD